MAKKPYSPVAGYSDLKRIEQALAAAQSVETIKKLVSKEGPKVGYKAFCYILGDKMTPEAMKPDEACVAAAGLEQQGQTEAANDIYKKVLAVHPDHPLARGKVGE